MTISKKRYDNIRRRYKRYEDARDRQYPGRLALSAAMQETLPPRPANDELGQVEVYEFVHDPPEKHMVYIDEKRRIATTWPGDKLGDVTFGSSYRDNFGGTRQPVWIRAINGHQYQGTYFKSAGDYARIRRLKGK